MFFYLLLLISIFTPSLWARDIILITYPLEQQMNAQFIQKVFTGEHHIPQRLVTLRTELNPCRVEDESWLHLCITEQGELISLKIKSKDLIKAFKIFQEGF